MKLISFFAIFFLIIILTEEVTLVVKKNRKYHKPPFCFSYTRDYNEKNDDTHSCTGYQFDCFKLTNEVIIGEIETIPKKFCTSSPVFRKFVDDDFIHRLAEEKRYVKNLLETDNEASGGSKDNQTNFFDV